MNYTIWITNSCNMKCKYCYVEEKRGQMFFLEENVDFLVDFIKNTNQNNEKLQINFFGGEPLLKVDLIQKIIARLEREDLANIHYSMTTNGLLLDKNIIEFIKEKKISLSLSWDGNEEANDCNRIDLNGNGTYKRIREKYELLQKCQINNVRVRATFNSDTMKLLETSIEHFLEIDEDISVIFVADYFDSKWDENKLNALQSSVEKLKKKNLHNIQVLGDELLRNGSCGGGITSYHIFPDGYIYPCSFVVNNTDFCIGNIFDGIDESKKNKLISNYKKRIPECAGCDYEKYCLSYKCKYLNWSLVGDFNQAAPIICRFENIKMCNNI